MEITIEHHDKSFNVNLHSKEGAEAFLSIKGCRIASGSKGDFVSYPATKNDRTDKWWNHVWGSEKFNDAVLKKAQQAKPKQTKGHPDDDDGDIPF